MTNSGDILLNINVILRLFYLCSFIICKYSFKCIFVFCDDLAVQVLIKVFSPLSPSYSTLE